MRIALYARVSTKDKEQDPETQLKPLREYCQQAGYSIIEKYVDFESGRSSTRIKFEEMRKAALQRKFDKILVWKMDRFSRRGIKDVFYTLDFLSKSCNVDVISLTEPYLSTDTPMKDLLLAILSWSAEMESKNISQRVKAGLERAKAQGTKLGRKRVNVDIDRIIEMRSKNIPFRKISKELGISVGKVYAVFKKHLQEV